MKIKVSPSPTADTRTCDYANVSHRELLNSSAQHIADVRRGLAFFGAVLAEAATQHDADKITDIDGFHADFIVGKVAGGAWLARHYQLNRHHLLTPDGVRDDVNLIDVLDFVADMVMASAARGSDFPIVISPDVLMLAFTNTVELLKAHIEVDRSRPNG
jgi:hypothetical protein